MSDTAGWSLRPRSLLLQVSVGIALAGLLALVVNTALSSLFLERHLVERQRSLMVRQVRALANCSTRVSVSRVEAKGPALTRIIEASLAGTPERRVLVTDETGRLRYASAFPAPLLRLLLTRLRRDVAAASTIRGASTIRSSIIGATMVTDIVGSCGTSRPGFGRHTTGILIAESRTVADREWSDIVVLELLSGLVGVILIVVAGAGLGRAIVRPVRKVTAAARAIASGEHDRRVMPEGPAEVRDLAVAFNTMADEVERRQHLDRDLLANMSHELGAPLGLIQGYAEGLADGVITEADQRVAALHAITNEAARLRDLTGNLLDLALLEAGEVDIHLEDVPIGELLTNLTSRFEPAALQRGVSLAVNVPTTLRTIRTDGLRLESILVNLLNNALRHSLEAGTITLSALPSAGGVTIAMSDTGTGIPADDLSRIWERFYQVDKGRDRRDRTSGLGLGLAICLSTVTLLGGRIDVESVVGAGTTFRIWLPQQYNSD